MTESQPFSLVKWYLDCVTDGGDAAILYCAELHWRGLHATMGSLLESRTDARLRTQFSMGRYRLSSTPGEIAVEHPRLKVKGRWLAAARPFERTVYESSEGSVLWNCVQSGSQVSLRVGDREMAGLGYAECLTLTIPPWRLPMQQLCWGRFVSAANTLAWIDWKGSYSTSFAVLNGRACPLESVSQSGVATSEAILHIEPGISLRSGRVADTILPGAPALRKLFPRNLFNVREQKWKSRGVLSCGDSSQQPGRSSIGWVIHEIVHWGEAVDWQP